MELHTRAITKATFDLPTPETVVTSAKYSFNGGPLISLVSTTEGNIASVDTPYLVSEGTFELTWSFVVPGSGSFTDKQVYDVVRPYLTIPEVKRIWPQATTAQAIELEAGVRHIINAHTGQSFGYGAKTLSVEGHGESALRMPERLVELTGLSTLTSTLDINSVIIVSDGWYIKKGWSQETGTIESDSLYWSGEHINSEVPEGEPGYEKPGHGYVIVAPGSGGNPTKWRDDYPFSVTGNWGWVSIPDAVKEAAKLLANDYACSEIAYRDRFLESIKSADWRLQFSSRAWTATGNVRADQLLSEYVILDWAVV